MFLRKWRAKRRIYKRLEYLDDNTEDNVKSTGPIYFRIETKWFGFGFAREFTPPFRNGRGIVLFKIHVGIWIKTGITDDYEGNLWAMRGSHRVDDKQPEEIRDWKGKVNVSEPST